MVLHIDGKPQRRTAEVRHANANRDTNANANHEVDAEREADANRDTDGEADTNTEGGVETDPGADTDPSADANNDGDAKLNEYTNLDEANVDFTLDVTRELLARLGVRRVRALLALVETPARTQAAARAGISRSTIYRYLEEPDFAKMLCELREEAARQALEEIQGAALTSTRTLIRLLSDPKSGVQLQAAKTIIQFYLNDRNFKEVTRQMDIIKMTQDLQERY